MASRSLLLSTFLLFLSLSTSIAFSGRNKKKLRQLQPCQTLVLYHHEITYNGKNGENATSTVIAAPDWAKKTMANQLFGGLVVFDSLVTLDNNRNSAAVGRAQGFYVYDDMEVFSVLLSFSVHLDSEDYKGTINFAGADLATNITSDISVIGGTGDFFMTRGIATMMVDAYDEDLAYTRLKVDIKLYECWQMAPDA